MPIPDYQETMLPFMRLIGDKAEYSLRETIEPLANEFKLTEQERKELLPSGQQTIFENRVGWAKTYLKKAGLIEPTRRGFSKLPNGAWTFSKRNLRKLTPNF